MGLSRGKEWVIDLLLFYHPRCNRTDPPKLELTPRSCDDGVVEITRMRNPNMDEILTIEEIEARFPSEWVLIAEPRVEEATSQILGGKLIYHSLDRDDVDRKAIELRLPDFALLYLGPWPENMELVL
jgi:hypothetical protein